MKEPINDGGPAFPSASVQTVFIEELGRYDDRLGPPMGGMSLRDYFAAKALAGIFASGSHRDIASAIEFDCSREGILTSPADIGHFAEERISAMAYTIADAMLTERAKS